MTAPEKAALVKENEPVLSSSLSNQRIRQANAGLPRNPDRLVELALAPSVDFKTGTASLLTNVAAGRHTDNASSKHLP